MSFFEEFKKFAMRGNVIDLAVGVVIGGAFGKITSSLVDNIIMPPLSLLFGKVDFSGLFISLNGQHYDTLKAAQDAHAPILAYGLFINTIVNFLIHCFCYFCTDQTNQQGLRLAGSAPEPRLCPFCKTAIADDATPLPALYFAIIKTIHFCASKALLSVSVFSYLRNQPIRCIMFRRFASSLYHEEVSSNIRRLFHVRL